MNRDNRKAARVELRVPAVITINGIPNKAEIQDISEGGVFVHCEAPCPIGASIMIAIQFKGTALLSGTSTSWSDLRSRLGMPEELKTGSVVRWIMSPPHRGFGVEFRNLDSKKRIVLKELVEYYQKAQRAAA